MIFPGKLFSRTLKVISLEHLREISFLMQKKATRESFCTIEKSFLPSLVLWLAETAIAGWRAQVFEAQCFFEAPN